MILRPPGSTLFPYTTLLRSGSEQERSLTATVRRAMNAPAIDLAGMTDLGEFAAVISALDLLVTNDTGASHVAAATGTPSRSEEHTSELQSRQYLVCRPLLEK